MNYDYELRVVIILKDCELRVTIVRYQVICMCWAQGWL